MRTPGSTTRAKPADAARSSQSHPFRYFMLSNSTGTQHRKFEMKDLAPDIFRQRLVIEGLIKKPIIADDIVQYLSKLSPTLDMTLLNEPVTHKSPLYGWAGWVHWETSGAHFYAWDQPRLFFSVDIYTCKKFDVDTAVNFTRNFFDATEIAFKSF